MRKTTVLVLVLVFLANVMPARVFSSSLPPYPSNKRSARSDGSDERKAQRLFQLLKKENRALRWDPCLGRKALVRAKQLVSDGYFAHEDPATGKNPAWTLIRRCYECRWAGENLAKGLDTPENIHKALMASPSHRKNILDPRFDRAGIACYDYICVELFAGF